MFSKGVFLQRLSGRPVDFVRGQLNGRRVVVYVKKSKAVTLSSFDREALALAKAQGVADVFGWDQTEPTTKSGGFYRLEANGTYSIIEDERQWHMIREFVALAEQQAA